MNTFNCTPVNNLITRQSYDRCYIKPQLNMDTYLNKNITKPEPPICGLLTYQQSISKGPQNIIPESTNLREKSQLHTRPYLGYFAGAGTPPTGDIIDLSSVLVQGVSANLREKSCLESRVSTFTRFDCLPEFGNPQRVQHIIYPWTRGGDQTRDYVRRVDYYRRCQLGLNVPKN